MVRQCVRRKAPPHQSDPTGNKSRLNCTKQFCPSLKKENGFTEKQEKFIAAYAGNGVEAARIAGYQGNDQTLRSVAYENLTKPHIRKAIEKRNEVEIEPLIASRLDRQALWTKIMECPKTPIRDRLRASELLARSEGDFKENNEPPEVIYKLAPEDLEKIKAIREELYAEI